MCIETIKKLIANSVEKLQKHSSFKRFMDDQEFKNGDILMINNSFVFRDVKTTKSNKYLSLVFGNNLEKEIKIATGMHINKDFKKIDQKSSNKPKTIPLKEATEKELENLGILVFILIGKINDNKINETELKNEMFKKVVWNPLNKEFVSFKDNEAIIVNQIEDEEKIWEKTEELLRINKREIPKDLKVKLGKSLDKLQEKAEADVEIPSPGQSPKFGIIDSILKVLKYQKKYYESVLNNLNNSYNQENSSLNEILRISYNFASDATGLLRLMVSICDLKPIVLWGTIAEHFALSEAFKDLPWTPSRNKPPLKNYEKLISNARNSSFHNLLPFNKTLRVKLSNDAIEEPVLKIFREHPGRREDLLYFKDKELVDVFNNFSRAKKKKLSTGFINKNLAIIDSTISLFESSNTYLKELSKSRY
jgi:hypothetical protein